MAYIDAALLIFLGREIDDKAICPHAGNLLPLLPPFPPAIRATPVVSSRLV